MTQRATEQPKAHEQASRQAERAVSNSSPGLRFNLATLLLWMAFISVMLSLFVTWPAVGILASVVLTPTLFRTISAVNFQNRSQGQIGPRKKIQCFFESLGVMLLAWLACLLGILLATLVFLGLSWLILLWEAMAAYRDYVGFFCFLGIGAVSLTLVLWIQHKLILTWPGRAAQQSQASPEDAI